jgi:peroxiredoxin
LQHTKKIAEMIQQQSTYQDDLETLRAQLKSTLPKAALKAFDNDAQQLSVDHKHILKMQKGDKAPNFILLNAKEHNVELDQLLKKGRVILVFYRGTWCPYCNLQLKKYQEALPYFADLDAQVVAVSPQNPDSSLSLQEKNDLAFEVLSDPGNTITRKFTTVFRNGEIPVKAMADLGFRFESFYSDNSREIPVPAVFIIEKDRTISFAKAESGDYRKRVEAEELLLALKQ